MEVADVLLESTSEIIVISSRELIEGTPENAENEKNKISNNKNFIILYNSF